MQHLIVPRCPAAPTERVGYLCSEPYDQGDFPTYPDRAGWASVVEHIDHRNDAGGYFATAEEFTRFEDFAQRWLFFGLLHAFLGELYHESHFLVQDESGHRVDTSGLSVLLKQWTADVEQKDVCAQKVTADRLVSCFEVVSATVIRLFSVFTALQRPGMPIHLNYLSGRLQDSKPLWTSVLSMAETLAHTLIACCRPENMSTATWSPLNERIWDVKPEPGKQQRTEREMLENGWCPSRASRATSQFTSLAARYFLGKLRPPDKGVLHNKCTSIGCSYSQIDMTSYQPSHVSGCQCKLVGWQDNGTSTARALRDGTFPVLRINGASIDDLVIEADPAGKSVPYVAISHVWADGLGNPEANELHACQLLRLRDMVSRLDGVQIWEGDPIDTTDLRVWCDTMCVPPHKPAAGKSYQELRDVAMLQMRRVYEQAAYVLILDRTILKYSVADVGPAEAAMRLFTSPWMERLWTLQEVLLATKPLIQFADGAVDMRILWSWIGDLCSQDIVYRPLSLNLEAQFRELRSRLGLYERYTFAQRFMSLCSSLSLRRVTVPSDEAVCIATMLDLEVSKILEASDEAKMVVIWDMIGSETSSIPQDIIFHSLPRLRASRFSWAPQSLLAPNEPVMRPSQLAGCVPQALERPDLCHQLCASGLNATLKAWQITASSPPDSLQQDELTSCEAHLAEQGVVPLIRDESGKWFRTYHGARETSSRRHEYMAFRSARGPFILLREKASHGMSSLRGLACHESLEQPQNGVLVEPFALIFYLEEDEDEQQLWSAAYDKAVTLRRAGQHPKWLQILLDPRHYKPTHKKSAAESLRALLRDNTARGSSEARQHSATDPLSSAAGRIVHDSGNPDKPRELGIHGPELVNYDDDFIEYALMIQRHSRSPNPVYNFVTRVLKIYIGQYFQVTKTFDENSRWIVS